MPGIDTFQMNTAHVCQENASRVRWVDGTTAIDLLLRLAFDEPVTRDDALRVLHTQPVRDERHRLDRAARLKARNRALLDAAQVLGADGPGEWIVANRLAQAIERFECRAWPRLAVGMSFNLSPSEQAIYRAFLVGDNVPKTPRHLYDLLK